MIFRLKNGNLFQLKAAAPTKAVLDYRGIVVAWWNYVTPDHESWWLKGGAFFNENDDFLIKNDDFMLAK